MTGQSREASVKTMQNMCDVLDKVENRGIEKGIVKGESRGENKMALLVKKLLDQNRIDDVKRASEDEKTVRS